MITPLMALDGNRILVTRSTAETDQLVTVDLTTGRSHILKAPRVDGTSTSAVDSSRRRLYLLRGNTLEAWRWHAGAFTRVTARSMPHLGTDVTIGNLVPVSGTDWLLYSAHWWSRSLFDLRPPITRFYGYNVNTGEAVLVLDSPNQTGVIVAWLPRGG
jgi:hypothetical protein